MISNLRCPACGEEDFDAFGLKLHFVNGHCEVAENQEKAEKEMIEYYEEIRYEE